ncbi:MAG: hypothetical protein K2X63_06205 [Burkholderiaceae bacterium]|nr:hypothetical protein [Burkholderiaceae bacterium]
MKKKFYFMLWIILFGLATESKAISDKDSALENAPLTDGIWDGMMRYEGTSGDDTHLTSEGKPFSGDVRILLTVCSGEVKFWLKSADGPYRATLSTYHHDSHYGNHLIFYQNNAMDGEIPPDWVETQALLIVEINEKLLRAQWSRSVSNPRLPDTDKLRNFFVSGVITLSRVSNNCSKEVLNPLKD